MTTLYRLYKVMQQYPQLVQLEVQQLQRVEVLVMGVVEIMEAIIVEDQVYLVDPRDILTMNLHQKLQLPPKVIREAVVAIEMVVALIADNICVRYN